MECSPLVDLLHKKINLSENGFSESKDAVQKGVTVNGTVCYYYEDCILSNDAREVIVDEFNDEAYMASFIYVHSDDFVMDLRDVFGDDRLKWHPNAEARLLDLLMECKRRSADRVWGDLVRDVNAQTGVNAALAAIVAEGGPSAGVKARKDFIAAYRVAVIEDIMFKRGCLEWVSLLNGDTPQRFHQLVEAVKLLRVFSEKISLFLAEEEQNANN